MAFDSVVSKNDQRFYYEPLFNGHDEVEVPPVTFGNRVMQNPIWISSMTGGTKEAGNINHNLARAASEFGLGMGLGSCRIILDDDTYLKDFQLRDTIGEAPLYANLGIAQLEELFQTGQSHKIKELINKTEADGLIIHVNPLQEWLQPEGDRFQQPPIDTIKRCLDLNMNLIVKEVGQGFGPKSMEALMNLPLQAIDFGAHGGTNFSKLELHRAPEVQQNVYQSVCSWGHTADEMVGIYQALNDKMGSLNKTSNIIVSGGVGNFTDGYYFIKRIGQNAVYGQASAFLRHARGSYEELQEFVQLQIKGLKLAFNYLNLKD